MNTNGKVCVFIKNRHETAIAVLKELIEAYYKNLVLLLDLYQDRPTKVVIVKRSLLL